MTDQLRPGGRAKVAVALIALVVGLIVLAFGVWIDSFSFWDVEKSDQSGPRLMIASTVALAIAGGLFAVLRRRAAASAAAVLVLLGIILATSKGDQDWGVLAVPALGVVAVVLALLACADEWG